MLDTKIPPSLDILANVRCAYAFQAKIGRSTHTLTKKGTDEDVAKLVKSLQTASIHEAACGRTEGETFKQMLADQETDGSCLGSDAKAAAAVGDVNELMSEEDEEEEEEDEEKKSGEGTKRQAASDPASSSSGKKQKTGDPTTPAKKPTWFDRDASITDALRAQGSWHCTTLDNYNALLTKSETTMARVVASNHDAVANEVKLLETRVTAVRLVLGLGKRSQDTAPAAVAPPAPAAEVTVGQLPPPKDVDALLGERLFSEVALLPKRLSIATGPTDEAQAASLPATPGSGIDPSQKGKAEAASPEKPVPAPSPQKPGSASSAGSPATSLAKYIASFGDTTSLRSSKVGTAPPCRSFRLLKCLGDFDQYVKLINAADHKTDIEKVKNSQLPHRTAISELLTMAKAAEGRLARALKTIDEKAAETLEEAKENAKSSKSGKKKAEATPDASANAANFHDSLASLQIAQVFSHPHKSGTKVTIDVMHPAVVRVDPSLLAGDSDLVKDAIAWRAKYVTDRLP